MFMDAVMKEVKKGLVFAFRVGGGGREGDDGTVCRRGLKERARWWC